MRLQEIMSREIKSLPSTATVTEARSVMRQQGVHHLLVIESRVVVGVVSDRDLGGPRARPNGEGGARLVSDVMARSVVGAGPETTVRQAANLLRGRSIGCLPVLDNGKPVGIVTTTDLLELLGRGIDRPVERGERRTLRDRGPRRSGPTSRRARGG